MLPNPHAFPLGSLMIISSSPLSKTELFMRSLTSAPTSLKLLLLPSDSIRHPDSFFPSTLQHLIQYPLLMLLPKSFSRTICSSLAWPPYWSPCLHPAPYPNPLLRKAAAVDGPAALPPIKTLRSPSLEPPVVFRIKRKLPKPQPVHLIALQLRQPLLFVPGIW